ncbi:MAG: DUF4339 domain-containing protein [Verrucomicrobia bacterium]|nr:DUF4339 domain-containing protein [Verrucomicrobiota bacterium]
MDIYIIRVGKEQEGPFSLEQITTFISEKSLKPYALVWYKGLSEWIMVKDLPNLGLNPTETRSTLPRPEKSNPNEELKSQKTETKKSLSGWIGLGVIAAVIASLILYNNIKTTHDRNQWVSLAETFFSDANKVILATGRGVNKSELYDAVGDITYKWTELMNKENGNSPKIEEINTKVEAGIQAWECALAWFDVKRFNFQDGSCTKENQSEWLPVLSSARIQLEKMLGENDFQKLKSSTTTGVVGINYSKESSELISLCFTTAQTDFSLAKKAFDHYRK